VYRWRFEDSQSLLVGGVGDEVGIGRGGAEVPEFERLREARWEGWREETDFLGARRGVKEVSEVEEFEEVEEGREVEVEGD
jgi:hypothetical protein